MENREENFSPIVKLKKLNLEDLLLKGVKIIKDETAILQEEMAGMRTRPKITKRYFVDENSVFDDSDSSEENPYYTSEEIEPKDKNSKRKKKDSVEDNSEFDNSDSQKESPDSDKASDSEEKKTKLKDKVSKRKSEKLTAYEKLVQKNKEEKLAFLDSLKISELKESFAEAVEGLKPKRKKWEKKTILVIPRINQKRSAKVEMNLSEKALKNKAVTLPDIIETPRKKLPQVITFKDALEEKESYEDFAKDFSDLGEYSTKPFQKYDSHFQTMQKLENKVGPYNGSGISSLSFHPMREKLILATSRTRDKKIGLWNVDSNSDPYEFEAHSERISHLKFNHDHPNMLVSSSYDGTLRCGDLEKRVFSEIYKTSDETACYYFDFVSAKTFLVSQKKEVAVVDVRNNGETSRMIHHSHDALIKSINVHPLDKNYFISTGMDGLIRLWDLRQLKNIPILEFKNPSEYVTSAFFSPLTGKHILTSGGSIVGLYYCADFTQVVLKNTLQRLESGSEGYFRAVWLSNRDDIFVIGGRYRRRRIEIYNDSMENIFSYENLPCDAFPHMFHPSLPVLAAASFGGRISILADRST